MDDPSACSRVEPSPTTYARRRPDRTVLHQVVREYAETLFAHAQERTASGFGYPVHVEKEFRRYVDCGILGRGFCRVHCPGCGRDELVAFSCKGRALCPSCVARRMSDTAARLVDERLPVAGCRQWVFSFPWRIRVALAKDGALLSRVLRVCMNKVFAHQRAQARAAGIANPRTLGISFVQRFGSLLQLNPHAHNIVPDGVLFDNDAGELTLWPLAPPTDQDVQAVAMRVVKAVLKLLANATPDDSIEDNEQAAAAALIEAARSPLCGNAEPTDRPLPKRRTAQVQTKLGMFSVHADTAVAADNRAGLERMLRYACRPPLAVKRLSRTATGKVCYRLRKPYFTGQTQIVLEPVAFLRRLAALVPPVRQNQVRYFGLLASQAADHHRLPALAPGFSPTPPPTSSASVDGASDPPSARQRAYRKTWAALLARVFSADVVTCTHCGSKRRIIAAITHRDVAVQILNHLDLPTDLPELSPARAPPQIELFDDP